ncbi:MAG TPA: hypothetical protein DEB39_01400 [Planctomycetaceae bacterium]|nr:hypothetical protein [Planctomycetaceae bacterium]
MLVENVLVRPLGNGMVSLNWTSENVAAWSWIFVNGKLLVGPYMAETKNRSVTIPVPTDGTFLVEVHDFEDETVPDSIEQHPLVKPRISWNRVEAAVYRIYHTIFDTGSIESLLLEVPPIGMERMEIDCPVSLEGRNGRWHSFRVETVDRFGNESINEIVPYFAVDLPPSPELIVSRDTKTGLLSFRIL